jgi:hypothetical protein
MTEDVTLCGDLFAPVTSAMGFLRAPLGVVVDGLVAWRQRIHGSADWGPLDGGIRANVAALEPLTGGVAPRELVISTGSAEWTAIFDCGIDGGDPRTTAGYLARTLKVQGVAVVSIPDVRASGGRSVRYGARQFEMFGPIGADFLNHVRSVSLVRDGERWRFDANGTVQDFEDVEAYGRRKVADRFTSSMLVDYAGALGLRPFEEEFFPGPSVLVRNPAVPPPGAVVLSLRDAQRRAGIIPAQQ